MRFLRNIIDTKGIILYRKKVLLLCSALFLCLLILSSCNPSELSSHTAPLSTISIDLKQDVSRTFFDIGLLKPLTISKSDFFMNIGWYDESNFLFISRENGQSLLQKHDIFSGEKETLFTHNEPIISVYPNHDYSRFAVQVVNKTNKSFVYMINKQGNVLYKWEGDNSGLQLMWNPYDSDEIYLAAFLANWDFNLYYVDLNQKTTETIDIENPFIQWVDHLKVGYLKWNQNDPSHFAPLYVYDLEKETEEKWLDDISAFMTFPNLIMTITIDSETFQESTFGFYDSISKEKMTELVMPTISTFSEHIWIPNHDFLAGKQLFYYFRPLGDNIEQLEGFQLRKFSIQKGTEEVVYEFDSELPFKLSPDGKWALVGRQLEQIIDLESNSLQPIVYHSK